MTTVAKGMKPGTSCFEAVGEAIAQLSAECNKLLPLAMKSESVFKSRPLLSLVFADIMLTITKSLARRCGSCELRRSEPAWRLMQKLSAKLRSCRKKYKTCAKSQDEGLNDTGVGSEDRARGAANGSG
jgi:hypothetical protein